MPTTSGSIRKRTSLGSVTVTALSPLSTRQAQDSLAASSSPRTPSPSKWKRKASASSSTSPTQSKSPSLTATNASSSPYGRWTNSRPTSQWPWTNRTTGSLSLAANPRALSFSTPKPASPLPTSPSPATLTTSSMTPNGNGFTSPVAKASLMLSRNPHPTTISALQRSPPPPEPAPVFSAPTSIATTSPFPIAETRK